MSIEDQPRAMVSRAIATHPAGMAKTEPTTSDAERHRADGAYPAYLVCLPLAFGAHHPPASNAFEGATAWRAVYDAIDAVLSQAAAIDWSTLSVQKGLAMVQHTASGGVAPPATAVRTAVTARAAHGPRQWRQLRTGQRWEELIPPLAHRPGAGTW